MQTEKSKTINEETQIDESEFKNNEKKMIEMIDLFKFIERETQTDDLVKKIILKKKNLILLFFSKIHQNQKIFLKFVKLVVNYNVRFLVVVYLFGVYHMAARTQFTVGVILKTQRDHSAKAKASMIQ